uniref:Uncharacterized protein n=1 Tax=Branchiostoma floridae TaxID=7739 RepID=C3ZNP1_BRAFL|eukprot:XP_002589882.1 hypothetical protein BRAFLDRAFT_98774 [Branchiostoma floridae]
MGHYQLSLWSYSNVFYRQSTGDMAHELSAACEHRYPLVSVVRYDDMSMPVRANASRSPEFAITASIAPKIKEELSSLVIHLYRTHVGCDEDVSISVNGNEGRKWHPVLFPNKCSYYRAIWTKNVHPITTSPTHQCCKVAISWVHGHFVNTCAMLNAKRSQS